MTLISKDCVSQLSVRVRLYETDLMGVVHHSNYVRYLELARVEYLSRRGLDYFTLTLNGIHLPVIEVELQYKRPARFGDEIVIETKLAEFSRAKVAFTYRIFRRDAKGETLLTTARTVLACVGIDLRPRRIPEEVEKILFQAEPADPSVP